MIREVGTERSTYRRRPCGKDYRDPPAQDSLGQFPGGKAIRAPPGSPKRMRGPLDGPMAEWGAAQRGDRLIFAKLRSPKDLQTSLLGRDDTLLAENISLLAGVGN